MKKKSVIVLLILLMVISACGKKEVSTDFSEDSQEVDQDYFSIENTLEKIEDAVGEAKVTLNTDKSKDYLPLVEIKNNHIETVKMSAELVGFDPDLKLFIDVDGATLDIVDINSDSIDIPLTDLASTLTDGYHIISFSQYQDNQEGYEFITRFYADNYVVESK